jgi:hypothetical protein
MKKKVNTKLLKSIIETDFLLFTGIINTNLKSLKSCNNSYSDKNVIYTLEIFELVKTLKQFIRFIQFLNTHESRCLHICSSSKQTLGFFNKYVEENSLRNLITVQNNFTKIKSSSTEIESLLLLEEPLKAHINVFKKLFEENILVVNKINSKIERNNFGTYKIFNNMLDFKKLIFLIVLIDRILLKKIK